LFFRKPGRGFWRLLPQARIKKAAAAKKCGSGFIKLSYQLSAHVINLLVVECLQKKQRFFTPQRHKDFSL
jgi:hypothetical protein